MKWRPCHFCFSAFWLLIFTSSLLSQDDRYYYHSYFKSSVYSELHDKKGGVHGRILGERYANREYSREELLQIVAGRFEDDFFLFAEHLEKKYGRKLGLGLSDISGLMAMGLYMPSDRDYELVFEALGKPERHELAEEDRDSSEYVLEIIHDGWRSQRWSERYGSLFDIAATSNKLAPQGVPRGKIRMLIDGEWQSMSPKDLGLRIHMAYKKRYFEKNYHGGFLKLDNRLRYDEAYKVLENAEQMGATAKGKLTNRLKQYVFEVLSDRSLYAYWDAAGTIASNAPFNLSGDRRKTYEHYKYNAGGNEWVEAMDSRRIESLEKWIRKVDLAEKEIAAVLQKERLKVILSYQKTLQELNVGIDVYTSGEWDYSSQQATQYFILALQFEETDNSHWDGKQDGVYTKTFAEHLSKRASQITSIDEQSIKPELVVDFANGLNELVKLDIYTEPTPF